VVKSLSDYTDDELIEELARRRNTREINKPERWCVDCKNFTTWNGKGDPPNDYNACIKGHKMNFAMPEGYTDDEFGFYRRVCVDRIVINDKLQNE